VRLRLRIVWYRVGYRSWSRLLHRFNLHHARRTGPMEDGAILNRCEWCGLHAKEWPNGVPGLKPLDGEG